MSGLTGTANKSLKFKLMLMSLSIAAVLGFTSLGVLSFLIDAQKMAQMKRFDADAVALSDAIGAQFYDRYGDAQAFGLNPALQSSNRQLIVDTLNSYLSLYEAYDLILVIDTNGQLLGTNTKTHDGKFVNTKGLYNRNFSNTPWFKAVMAGRFTEDKARGYVGTFFEDVQIDPWVSEVYGQKTLGTSFSAPLKNAKGEVIGVISNRANSRWFETAFKESFEGLKKSGYGQSLISLMGKDGTLLYEYSSDPTLEKLQASQYDWNYLLKFNVIASGNEAAKRAAAGESGRTVLKNTRTGEMQIAVYAPVTSRKFLDKIGWSLMVRDAESEVYHNANRAQIMFYILFAVLLSLTCFISYVFSNQLSKSLEGLASRLSVGSTEVTSAAASVSKSSSELSDAITEQASAIQETAASIDEVSSMVKKSADNAARSQKVSMSSRETAGKGQEALQEMIRAINDISQSNSAIMTQVEDGNRQISEIAKVISEIGNKTKVINDIVFQTKLLSFNASVEAARAGEHGKGFAVVAEEVGNLAQMSGNAAKEISTMLEASIQKVEGIVNETKAKVEHLVVESKTKVDVGTRIAQKCSESLSNILVTVQDVDGMIGEIASASNEQAQGVSEINKAINQLDEVTQQNSSIAQNAASSAEKLSNQAVNLRKVVEDLFGLVNGNSETKSHQISSFVQPSGSEDSKVVSIAQKTKAKPAVSKASTKSATKTAYSAPLRKAAGAETGAVSGLALPSKDDSRFEDV